MSLTAQDLESLLRQGIRTRREKEQAARAEQGKDTRSGPYITDLGAECDLKLIRSFRSEPEDAPDVASEFTFTMGHALEEVVAEWLHAVNVEFLREIRIEIPVEGTTVSGRVDYLLLADDTLVELKAKGWSGFSYALDRNELPSKQHRAQLNGYLHATHLGALSYAAEDGPCSCGDKRAEHIYGEGACRPGFACLEACDTYRPRRVTIPPQDRGVILYAGFPPKWDDKNYSRPFAAFDVVYNSAVAAQQLDYVADLWRAAQSELPSTDLAPVKHPDYFPCATRNKRTGELKTWCAFYAACHQGGQR